MNCELVFGVSTHTLFIKNFAEFTNSKVKNNLPIKNKILYFNYENKTSFCPQLGNS